MSGYDAQAAHAYSRSRELDSAQLAAWREALLPHLNTMGNTPIIDLGAGTGAFARLISLWFNLRVIAVEPSQAMLANGLRYGQIQNVLYVAARAQALPFCKATFGAAWLSTVVHQIADLAACARQLRHVLQLGSPVLIRTAFGDRLDDITLFRYFPEAKQVATRFPTVRETVAAFGGGGFTLESLESIPQASAPTLQEFRLGMHNLRLADSTMRPLSDEAFDRGLERLDIDLAAGKNGPVVDRLDLLVLR